MYSSKLKGGLVKFIAAFIIGCSLALGFANVGKLHAETTATVVNVTSYLNIRKDPNTTSTVLGKLYPGGKVTVLDSTSTAGWYKIQSGTITGWCSSDYLKIDTNTTDPTPTDADFETLLAKFPASYQDSLKTLHASHPKWVFTPVECGDWMSAVGIEAASGVSLVPLSSDRSWLDLEDRGVVDAPDWVNASDDIIAYYMDPRNMLTDNMVFQFMDLNYSSTEITADAINKATNGTFLASVTGYTVSDAFLKAGKDYRINPLFLVTHIIQECGTNGSASSNGSSGYYNMYNIGAYSDEVNAVRHGITFAQYGVNATFNAEYNIPWNTGDKSIVYGGKWIANYYMNAGQNSLYFMRFNLANNASNRGSHQYMTALQSCASEAQRMYDSYKNAGILDSVTINFSIPVYSNMPDKATPSPATVGVTGYPTDYANAGWKQVDGKWYYYDEYGVKKKGWIKLDSTWYYLDKTSGVMKTGWQTIDSKKYYFNSKGAMETGWQDIGDYKYYFKDSGEMVTGMQKINGNTYSFTANGRMMYGWKVLDNKKYYFGTDGVMRTGWQKIKDIWYLFGDDGVMKTGWQKVNNVWYFLDKTSGEMQTGWIEDNKVKYYLDESGAMKTGWVKIDDIWYLFANSGAMQTGWQYVGNVWYYMNANGEMQTGWITVNGKNYFMNDSGAMVSSGWIKEDGKWFYLNASGDTAKGWLLAGSTWYYLDKTTGEMQTGWITDGATKYYLQDSGAMATGWIKLDGTWYYLHPSGAMAKGWQYLGGVWYYLDPETGKMATGMTNVGSATYYMADSGAMKTGWVSVNCEWYYFNESGAMAKDTWIGNYYVDASGVWTASK